MGVGLIELDSNLPLATDVDGVWGLIENEVSSIGRNEHSQDASLLSPVLLAMQLPVSLLVSSPEVLFVPVTSSPQDVLISK